MDVFEEIVMSYLVRDGQTFLSPQFNLKTRIGGKPWSCCPDFVAIHPSERLVSVVEVSTGSNTSTSKLAKKTNNWCGEWGAILTNHLIANKIIDQTWNPLQVHIFIRKDQKDGFLKRISSHDRVKVEIIEDMWCHWSPDWWKHKLTEDDLSEEKSEHSR